MEGPLNERPRGWTRLSTGLSVPQIIRHKITEEGQSNSCVTRELVGSYWDDNQNWTPQVSQTWTTIESIVIVLNCIQIGAECQWTVRDYASLESWYFVMDLFFLGMYTTGIIIRLTLHGVEDYFCGLQAKWNMLDVILTVLGYIPCLQKMHVLNGEESVRIGAMIGLLRVVRIVRIVKVLRHVKNLTVVVEGLARSLPSIFWIIVMMILFIYTFGIFFTLTVDPNAFEEDHFSSLLVSMATLADMIMGNAWAPIMAPLVKHQPTLVPFFFSFTIIAQIGLLNLIVGVIVDATAATRSRIEWNQRKQDLKDLSDFWTQVLPVHDVQLGDSDEEELSPQRKHKIMKILQSILDSRIVDFPPALTAFELYDMLDVDANGGLSHKEFVIGIGRILLGDCFQLAITDLAMQGESRRHAREADRENKQTLDNITNRITGIERAVATLVANLHKGCDQSSGTRCQSSGVRL